MEKCWRGKFHSNEWEFKFLIPLSLPLHLLDSLQSLPSKFVGGNWCARHVRRWRPQLRRFILVASPSMPARQTRRLASSFSSANEPNQGFTGMRRRETWLLNARWQLLDESSKRLCVFFTTCDEKGECLPFHYPSVCASSIPSLPVR